MECYERRGTKDSLQPTRVPPSPSIARILTRLGLAEDTTLSGASIEQLIVALQDHRWERRASAATALGKVGASAPIDQLVLALQDEYEEVRAAVARALGRVGKSAPVSALVATLQDRSPLVREAAATALGKVGASAAITSLVLALQDECEEVRAAVAQALGRIGEYVPISVLVAVLQDQHLLVREAAAEALGVLGNSDARLPLLAHIQDEEALVRDAVAQALMQLERDVSQELIRLLLQEKEQSVQNAARSAVSGLINLGLHVHEENANIASMVIALQSVDKIVQKIAMCYLIGRALDVLNEKIPIAPLIDVLREDHQQRTKIREGVWETFRSIAQGTLRERKIIRLLMTAANDHDGTVQSEMRQAVRWLIDLALALQEERSSTEHLRAVLQDSGSSEYEATLRYLMRQALEALEEREPIEPILAELSRPEPQKRADVGSKLSKRARKALMGRMPGGPLIISLKRTHGLAPIELQFGDNQEEEAKEGRHIFPWEGPIRSQLKLPSRSDLSQCGPLVITTSNTCYK